MPPTVSLEQSVPLRAPAAEDERAMILAARRGDEEAFRDLYEAYREPVWRLANGLIGDPVQAQDVLQNVFLKAFRGLPGFRFQSCLFTWIYRIARNECLNHIRKRDASLIPLQVIVGSRDEIDGNLVSEAQRARGDELRDAVGRLPFKMREVIVLRYMQDLSYHEMSRVLGCPPGTVASRLARALAELETRLRMSGEGSEGPGEDRERTK
jgi:RNA polymerase sigma-70 factor (ECF subfamily)